jgi:hypothetical protein
MWLGLEIKNKCVFFEGLLEKRLTGKRKRKKYEEIFRLGF